MVLVSMGLDDPENLRLEALLGFAIVFLTSFIVIDKMPETASYAGTVAILGLVSWIGMPYLIYRDIEELPDINWRPSKYFYTFLGLLPYINVAFVFFYVLKRQRINESIKNRNMSLFRDEWWKLTLGSALIFLVGGTIFNVVASNSAEITLLGDIGMILAIIGWVGVPLSMSFDRTYLKNSYGLTFGKHMTKISTIPVLGILIAIIYVTERQSKISGVQSKQKEQRSRNRKYR